jgi:hypothetical protein
LHDGSFSGGKESSQPGSKDSANLLDIPARARIWVMIQPHLARSRLALYACSTMSDMPDWEERCALALSEIDRKDLDDTTKLDRVRRMLTGELDEDDDRAHVWAEIGMDPIPGTHSSSPGNTIHYRCRNCNALGYRVVFPTSVTLYPIVSDVPSCKA